MPDPNGRRRSVEAVRGDQVGDLLAGDRGRDPARPRPPRKWAHRRIDGESGYGARSRTAAWPRWHAKPGRPGTQRDWQLEAARAEIAQLTEAVKAPGDRAVGRCGENPVGAERAGAGAGPRRRQGSRPEERRRRGRGRGWLTPGVCGLWQVSDSRLHHWRVRRPRHRHPGRPGSRAGIRCTALLSEEIAAILDVAEQLGHRRTAGPRKLAHRGSYEHLGVVSPSTFRRVLIEPTGSPCPRPAPRTRTEKRHRRPDWLVMRNRTGYGSGMQHISPAPVGSASRSWTWSPEVDRHHWFRSRRPLPRSRGDLRARDADRRGCWSCSP